MCFFEFLRALIRKAAREAEETRTRVAYLLQQDSETEADDWNNAEAWNTRGPARRRTQPNGI